MFMDNQGFLQSAVGKIGEFFQWLKEKMEDDRYGVKLTQFGFESGHGYRVRHPR
jgi:hypothetical protein